MSISLMSNGRIGSLGAWCGTDADEIIYPAVSTCVTVTARTPNGLVGAHFFRGNPPSVMNGDIAEFATLANDTGRVNQVYVVGHFGEWIGIRNRTGYTVAENSLIRKLADDMGYHGGFATRDISGTGERDLRVTPHHLHVKVESKLSAGGVYAEIRQNQFDLMIRA